MAKGDGKKLVMPGLEEFLEEDWKKEWQGMPEFVRFDLEPFQKIVVNFKTKEDVAEFAKLVGQKLTPETDSMWFPPNKTPTGVFVDKEVLDAEEGSDEEQV